MEDSVDNQSKIRKLKDEIFEKVDELDSSIEKKVARQVAFYQIERNKKKEELRHEFQKLSKYDDEYRKIAEEVKAEKKYADEKELAEKIEHKYIENKIDEELWMYKDIKSIYLMLKSIPKIVKRRYSYLSRLFDLLALLEEEKEEDTEKKG